MKRTWNDIKWIFESDGSLRDIYVQDISLKEWGILIEHINNNFSLTYSDKDKIDKEYVLKYLQDTSGEMESKQLTIRLGKIKINCYFFHDKQIEFDIDPNEINTLNDFERIEDFMTSISEVLQEQVTLTGENAPEFPLFKVDTKNYINKILSAKEAKELAGVRNSVPIQLHIIRSNLMLKFFPDQFKKRLFESASEEYKPTIKEKNVW